VSHVSHLAKAADLLRRAVEAHEVDFLVGRISPDEFVAHIERIAEQYGQLAAIEHGMLPAELAVDQHAPCPLARRT
jgi:hypothetical protein